jgi:hypothetical protein
LAFRPLPKRKVVATESVQLTSINSAKVVGSGTCSPWRRIPSI